MGIAEVDPQRRLVIADIPGLIEGAAQGAGLGHDFLRHIERTETIVHLLDAAPLDETNPADNYRAIRAELAAYSEALAEKPELVVINKIDLLPDPAERDRKVKDICRELGLTLGKDAVAISGAARQGLKPLLERLWLLVHPAGGGEEPAWKAAAAG